MPSFFDKRTNPYDNDLTTTLFAWVAFLGFPLFYMIWAYLLETEYVDIRFHALGFFLTLPLLFERYWPPHYFKLKNFYTLLAMIYSLPFFFTWWMVHNDFSPLSLIYAGAAYGFLAIFLEGFDFVISSLIGIIAAFFWCQFEMDLFTWKEIAEHLPAVTLCLYAATLISILFSDRDRAEQEKISGMSMVGETIAHEVRTHLLGLRSMVSMVQRHMPTLFRAYDLARDHQLNVPEIRDDQYAMLLHSWDRMESRINYANTVIDILLMNVGRQHVDPLSFVECDLLTCIDEALERYPFASKRDRDSIHVDRSYTISFFGPKVLVIHVLFNLIKNALHAMIRAGKGEIFISIHSEENDHCLKFKDTGTGISPKDLPKIFDRFFTSTQGGTGIGLAFCKTVMQGLGGDIAVESVLGEYTEFLLRFPKHYQKKAL